MRQLEVISVPLGSRRWPDYVDCRVLAANTAEQHTVPPGANHLMISPNAGVYIAYGANPTAVVPAADVTDGTSNEYIQAGLETVRYVVGSAKISLITAASGGAIVTLAWYSSGP